MYVVLDNKICSVQWFQHHKPGKGGAYMKVKAKDISGGQIIEKTFRANETILQAIVERKPAQYLYQEDGFYIFMSLEDYSQLRLDSGIVGDSKNFLIEGQEAELLVYDGKALDIELPPRIEMKIVKAQPGVRGNTVSGATKPAQTETGHTVNVPLFVEQGETVIIDTRTGEYKSRAGA